MDENIIDVQSLKAQGFTDEDLAPHIPQENETSSEAVTDVKQETEESVETTEENETSQTVSDTDSKLKPSVVSYDRFKEVNEAKKLLEARIAALESQQQPAQQSTQQPAQQQPAQQQQQPMSMSEYIEQTADTEVRSKLNIPKNVDVTDFGWQIENPALHSKYLKEVAKAEYRIESTLQEQYNDNASFVQEFNSKPNSQVLYNFALQELREMQNDDDPVRIAAANMLTNAVINVEAGKASKKEIAMLKKFTTQCEQRINTINQPPTQAAISMPSPVVNPLDKAAGLPRANNLSGAKTSAMSWAQVEQLIQEGKVDQIPKEMLSKIDPRLIE